MKTTIIVNPIAGKRNEACIREAAGVLKSNGAIPVIRETTKRGDALLFAREEIGKGTETVIAAGGDGTVNEVANGLVGTPVKLAVLPLGTANVFSLETQIPSDPVSAMDVVLRGVPTPINVGCIRLSEVSGEGEVSIHFLLMAGAGFDAGVVRELTRGKISMWGKAAYFYTGLRVLSHYTHALLSVTVDQGKVIKGYSAVIGKAHYYGGGYEITPQASLFDDTLDLCLFQGEGAWNMLRYVWGVLRKKHLGYSDVYYCKAKEIEISSQVEVFVQADGDLCGRLPAYLSVKKGALTVMLPENN
jgi:diacylglycerol kinase (ATP)